MSDTPTVAPAGLKGLQVADTHIGSVRGEQGFFHYRQFDATELAAGRSFEAVVGLLLNGDLPDATRESELRAALGRHRCVEPRVGELAAQLARAGVPPTHALRALLTAALPPTPSMDQSDGERYEAALRAIGATPALLAAVYRIQRGLDPIRADPDLPHATDFVRMATGVLPPPERATAVERYLSLTADHGFNASTFAARVITSTGADLGGALAGACAALSGPLHGGAPSRVLDMLDAIGEPANTASYARRQVEAGRVIMGFGHAVYRAGDPRSAMLRRTAQELGGDLVERATAIEARMLAFLRDWKPQATLVTNVEFYAAVVLHLAGVPQEMFTAAFTTSRMVGWCAHALEQAADNKIFRPAARYVGPAPSQPVPPA